MKNIPSRITLLALLTFACACAAPTEEEDTAAPAINPELGSTVTPQADPPSPWDDGDTMGDRFGRKGGGPGRSACLPGPQKMDCLRHCAAQSPRHQDPDVCISFCTGC